MHRNHILGRAAQTAIVAAAFAVRALPAQQGVPSDRGRIADAVREDLSRLSDLERTYFATHKRYSGDIQALKFVPASGALIALTYASARTFSASASHVRLAPFICFIIVSSPAADSPADKPFCTDSRFGTAASALARAGEPEPPSVAPPPPSVQRPPPPENVMTVTRRNAGGTDSPAHVLSVTQFAERLRRAAAAAGDSTVVIVQFAVGDARYDPSRGVLEIAIEPVPLPVVRPLPPDTGAVRLALECHTHPAFVCGAAGLTYIARDLWRIPPSKAPDRDVLLAGLTLRGRFAIARRNRAAKPSLTLLALLLQANGATVSRWDATSGH